MRTLKTQSGAIRPATYPPVRPLVVLLLLLTLTFFSSPVRSDSCIKIIQELSSPANENSAQLSQQLKLWLNWEQNSNLLLWRQGADRLDMLSTLVPSEAVTLEILDKQPESELLSSLVGQGSRLRWFKHPRNGDSRVPFFSQANDGPVLQTHRTASRSVVFLLEGQAFSMKVPTDHPCSEVNGIQSDKSDMKGDTLFAIRRSQWLEKVDQELGLDPEFYFLREMATVYEKATKNGFVIRDLRPLQDGNYYLPAFSIPFVGAEIAKLNGENYFPFWKKHYAAAVGAAKAKLLLRYGLEMETPNPQNVLIQLDTNFKPTGKIIFRDVSDTDFVRTVAEALGMKDQIKEEEQWGYPPHEKIDTKWYLSVVRFDQEGTHLLKGQWARSWFYAHNKAFINEIEKTLHATLKVRVYDEKSIYWMTSFLSTPEAGNRIRELRSLRD